MSDKGCIKLYLSGRVQGVGMRYAVQSLGRSLGLTGYVKNLYDGNVEVVARGSEKDLDELYDRLKNNRVTSMGYIQFVEIERFNRDELFSGFEIR